MKLKLRQSLKQIGTKLSLMILVGIIIVSVIIVLISVNTSNTMAVKLLGENVLGVSSTTAAYIDGDKFERLINNYDSEEDFYIEMQKLMYKAKQNTNTTYLYAVIKNSDGSFTYIIDGSGELGSEDSSEYGYCDKVEIFPVEAYTTLGKGISSHTEIYHDDIYGNLISGFSPIKNSKGDIVGAVGCDIVANDALAMIKSFQYKVVFLVFVN